MSKQDITISVDVPDGFQATGEFRCAAFGDLYIAWPGRAARWEMASTSPAEVVILRKVEPKRESRWVAVMDAGELCCIHPHVSHQHCVGTLVPARKPAAVIRIDYENCVPVSAALEPLPAGEGE